MQHVKNTQRSSGAHQQGFVSIIVAILLMVILSLITVGFTRLMQREQRQAIDRQLSRQALYAAESGINDTVIKLRNDPAMPSDKTTCDTNGYGIDNAGTLSDSGTAGSPTDDIAYTCIMYDRTPGALHYTVAEDKSRIVEVKTESGNPFVSFNFTWGNATDPTLNNDVNSLPQCQFANDFTAMPPSRATLTPIVKVELTPTGSGLSRASLINNTDFFYLIPCRASNPPSTIAYAPNSASPQNRVKVVPVRCGPPNRPAGDVQPCTMTVNALELIPSNAFLIRLKSIYAPAEVTVTGEERLPDGSTGTATFGGTQMSIDVTARASDIVRRLRASAPVSVSSPDFSVPEAVLQGMDGICKQLDIADGRVSPPPFNDLCLGDLGNPAPPTPPVVPPPQPTGDGYNPVVAGGRIFNMFHHRPGLVIICHNPNLSDCGWAENNAFVSPYNSNLVVSGNRLYYTAQENNANPTRNFGIGCYDYIFNTFCGFTVLGTTSFTSTSAPTSDVNNDSGVGGIVEVGGKFYTVGIDTAGNQLIYCAQVSGSSVIACPGFTPYNIGAAPTVNGTLDFFVTTYNVDSSGRLYFLTNNATPAYSMSLGCFDTVSRNTCAGWSVRSFSPSVYNNAAVMVDNSLCMFEQNINVQPIFFKNECYSTADGTVTAQPPGLLTQAMPAAATNGFWWSTFEPYYNGTRVYLSGFNYGAGGATYCYDSAIDGICNGWNGDNGWQDGVAAGNDFRDFLTYNVVQYGSCLYGVGDHADTRVEGIVTMSPGNAARCP